MCMYVYAIRKSRHVTSTHCWGRVGTIFFLNIYNLAYRRGWKQFFYLNNKSFFSKFVLIFFFIDCRLSFVMVWLAYMVLFLL